MARPALPSSVRTPLTVLSLLGAIAAVVMALVFAGHSLPTPFDAWALRVAQSTVSDPWARFTPAWIVGTLGDPPVAAVLVAILAVVCWRLGRKRLAVLAVAGPAVTGVVIELVKPLIDRTINGDNLSYPSGHTAFMTGFGIVVGLLLVDRFELLERRSPTGTAVVVGCAALGGAAMSWSQTASVVHYATDTIGGFCTAFALLIPIARLIDRLASRGLNAIPRQ